MNVHKLNLEINLIISTLYTIMYYKNSTSVLLSNIHVFESLIKSLYFEAMQKNIQRNINFRYDVKTLIIKNNRLRSTYVC
jgi:hypothetical protein